MNRSGTHGLLNLDKPSGPTSRDVVNQVVRLVGRNVKVGHAGTLDPLASGVLVVAIGAATRLVESVQRMPKSYRATVRLGARSDTDDADGAITETPAAPVPGLDAIRHALESQVGAIEQVPPAFSAIKEAGQRAYARARMGESVVLKARTIFVERLDVVTYAWPRLELDITCGGGTYVRSIARDLGDRLGCGGLIESLQRTRIGAFTIASAIDPAILRRDNLPGYLRPMTDALGNLPRVTLGPEEVVRVVQGQSLETARLGAAVPIGELGLLAPDGQLIGLGMNDGRRMRPSRVFNTT